MICSYMYNVELLDNLGFDFCQHHSTSVKPFSFFRLRNKHIEIRA